MIPKLGLTILLLGMFSAQLPASPIPPPKTPEITPQGSILFTVCGFAVAFQYAGEVYIFDAIQPGWLIQEELAQKHGEPVLIVKLPSEHCSCEI